MLCCSIGLKPICANKDIKLILLNPNNHYNHGFHNTFDYKHFIYSDCLLYTVTASAHIH